MEIKVCGMREVDNIRLLESEVAPDWMGMIFYPKSSRFVTGESAEKLKKVALRKVGVFVNETIEVILEKIEQFQLSAVQLHGSESAEFVQELKRKTNTELWKVNSIKDEIDWQTLSEYLPFVSRFLFDTATPKYGGSGRKFNWKVLDSYPFEAEFMLSGGLDEESVGEVLALAEKLPQLIGVDLNSKFEDASGLKNIEQLKRFKSKIKP